MVDIAEVGDGDVVFVTGAAGGVGSLAGQIARCRGAARVIGSAGSQSKVDYLVQELGYDAAFNYHDGPVLEQLRTLAPDGLTVCFDNVGGEQLAAALDAAAPGARFALCGSLSTQLPGGPDRFREPDTAAAEKRQVDLRPFSTYHTPEQVQAWTEHGSRWVREGRLVIAQTIVDGGLPKAPQAMVNLTQGAYRGSVALHVS
jgi:NADPH-dependent curcumin reductase CurA